MERSRTVDPPARRRNRRAPVLLVGTALVILLVDQLTKAWAVASLEGRPPVNLVGDLVRLVLLRNSGAAFSLGTGYTIVLTMVAAVVVAVICWTARIVRSRWWAWGLGLVLGGATGNLVDRLVRSPGALRGHVVDFLSVGWWPVFNVADSCLVAGVIVICGAVLRGEDLRGRDAERTESDIGPGTVDG